MSQEIFLEDQFFALVSLEDCLQSVLHGTLNPTILLCHAVFMCT